MANNEELIPAPDKVKVRNIQLIDNLKTGIAIINYQWVYIYLNKSYARLMQMTFQNVLGQTLFELGSEKKEDNFFNNVCHHVMHKRTALKVEIYFKQQDYWRIVRVAPIPEGILIKLKSRQIN